MRKTKQKIFTLRAISIAAFIGSPLTAGLLIYKNFKSFGNIKAAKMTLLTCFIFTIIAFTIFFTIPERLDSKYIKIVLPVLYSTITAIVADKFQGKLIDEHLQNNFSKASWLLVPVYSLMTLAMVIIIYYATMLTLPFKGYERTKFIYYDVRMHYNNDIDSKVSKHLAELLRNSGYFKGTKNDIFVDKIEDNYQLKLIYKDTMRMKKPYVKEGIIFFKNYMNIYFSNQNQIEVIHTDKWFKNRRILENKSSTSQIFFDTYKKLQVKYLNKHRIYYNENMPFSDIQILEGVMKKLQNYFPEDEDIVLIFINNGNDYTLKFIVPSWRWNDHQMKSRLLEIENYINTTNINKHTNISIVNILTCEEMKINQST